MYVCPKSMWPAVKAMLHSVYDQPDADGVNAQFDRLLDYVEDKLPAAHAHLDAARADILAFIGFPDGLWAQISSNNPNEHLNRGESVDAPTPSASSPTATRSSASSAPSLRNRLTNGPRDAATSASTSSRKAVSPSSPAPETK